MRAGPILLTLAAALLAACQMSLPAGKAPEGGALQPEAIEVTPLDALPAAPLADSAAEEAALPEPAADLSEPEAALSDVEPAVPEPEAQISEPAPQASEPAPGPDSPEALACLADGGQWSPAGETGAYFCVLPTKDGGQQCTKESDCEGQCLARSGTCAPFRPLFGCNEVLDKAGRAIMLCID
jgi:hypothetical protein